MICLLRDIVNIHSEFIEKGYHRAEILGVIYALA